MRAPPITDLPSVALVELTGDQRREQVNTEQRFQAWRQAKSRAGSFRGSLGWHEVQGRQYLTRSYYDRAGLRRQKVEGLRDPSTETLKSDWDRSREEALGRERDLRAALERQAAANRAWRLGRVPLLGARIVRAIDGAGLLGNGLRVVGTNAIYAYEAVAGVAADPAVTTTLDIDDLLDARQTLAVEASDDVPESTLIGILRKVDRSFARTGETFRAANRDGYLVDLIKPHPQPPWKDERSSIGQAADELEAIGIDGLGWLQSAPSFEATAIDERGEPLRIVASDPRVFAAHKLWMSTRMTREAVKRRRDRAQAAVVAGIVSRYLTHLPYDPGELRMLPLDVFEAARPLFAAAADG